MMRPDLHLHTTASDGIFDSAQVARLVQRADVTIFSVTDHDTLSGIPQAADAAYERGLAFIPGVEISTEGEEEVHVLGYGVKANDPVLTAFFDDMAQERTERFRTMGLRLAAQGLPLPLDEILSDAGASIGRPHLARAMVKAGYVSGTQEAFEKYLGRGCPAYVPRESLPASKAVRLLRDRGAVPVLAHPGLIKWPMERLLPLISAWQDAGLMGIEVYHPANRGNYAYWDRLARERKLLVTGGSDFHDGTPRHGLIGETAAEWPTAGEDAWILYRKTHR